MSDDLPVYRQELQHEFSPNYNGYLYFVMTNLIALGAIAAALVFIRDVRPLEWITVPLAFLFANFMEWLSHRGPMHHRRDFMEMLFNRHTLVHHMYFPHDDMSVRTHREWGYVLFPAWAIFLFFITAGIPTLILWLILGQNVALLFFIVAVVYYILYEWLHLIYHLPEDSRILRNRAILLLRKHHLYHHHKRLMQKYNFNVTFPIFDFLFRTAWRGEDGMAGRPGVVSEGCLASGASETAGDVQAKRSSRG